MHYKALQTEALGLAGQDTGGDFETILKGALNRIYRLMLQVANTDEQRREFSLTTRASTSQYGMPLYVKRVLNIEDATNKKQVYDISSKEFDQNYPGTTTEGTPWKAYPLGVFGIQRQLATAGKLTLVSSSALDVTNFTVRVTGFVSGVLTTEVVTLTGTTGVQTSNTFDAAGIERIVRRSGTGYTITGNVTVTDGTNTLSVIPVWWDSPSYLWYEFYPIPSAAITYTVRALMRKADLVKDEDWPEIDEDFHSTLMKGALAEVLPVVGKTQQAQMYQAAYDKEIKDFRSVYGQQPNRTRVFSDISTETNILGIRRPQVQGVDYV